MTAPRPEVPKELVRWLYPHMPYCAINLPHCDNMTPPTYSGPWRDWHRGHDCPLDPDRPLPACTCGRDAEIAAALIVAAKAKYAPRPDWKTAVIQPRTKADLPVPLIQALGAWRDTKGADTLTSANALIEVHAAIERHVAAALAEARVRAIEDVNP